MNPSSFVDIVGELIWLGWTSLLDYLAAHVLLCLVPVFVIAGYMAAMIPKEDITRYLGPGAKKWVSYPVPAMGDFILTGLLFGMVLVAVLDREGTFKEATT